MSSVSEEKAIKTTFRKEDCKAFLQAMPLFSRFDALTLDTLLKKSFIRDYPKDSLLCFAGDTAEFLYVVLHGWVKLFRQNRSGHEFIISVLRNQDIFGRNAICESNLFAYTAQAVTAVTILQIPAHSLLEIKEKGQSFDSFLQQLLESELEEGNRLLLESEHLACMTSVERLGCFLLKMCCGTQMGSVMLQFPYEKSVVAGQLGMTPETFSRSLSQLLPLGVENRNATVYIKCLEHLNRHICAHCSATRKECPFGMAETG